MSAKRIILNCGSRAEYRQRTHFGAENRNPAFAFFANPASSSGVTRFQLIRISIHAPRGTKPDRLEKPTPRRGNLGCSASGELLSTSGRFSLRPLPPANPPLCLRPGKEGPRRGWVAVGRIPFIRPSSPAGGRHIHCNGVFPLEYRVREHLQAIAKGNRRCPTALRFPAPPKAACQTAFAERRLETKSLFLRGRP